MSEPDRVVTDTGELRWFAPGPLPSDVRDWFVVDNARVSVEDRCDSYRLVGRADMGVKWRAGAVLELKVRQSIDAATVALGPGLTGRIEGWRRWSPAEDLVEAEPGFEWVDVAKTVVKRRVRGDGSEVPVEPDQLRGEFCDVELVSITVGDTLWWSLVLTAYGAVTTRPVLMRGAWDLVASASPHPRALNSAELRPLSYPAWLSGHLPPASKSGPSGVMAAG